MVSHFDKPQENRIGELRNYHLMSQQFLVDRINEICGTKYYQKAVSRWETRQSHIPTPVLVALVLIFDVTMEYILCMSDVEQIPLYARYENVKKSIRRD